MRLSNNVDTSVVNSHSQPKRPFLRKMTLLRVCALLLVFVVSVAFVKVSSLQNAHASSVNTHVSKADGVTYYKIINRQSGLALDVTGLSTNSGAAVIQWPYNGGANQQWQEILVDGNYELVNRNSGLLLDEPGSSGNPGVALDQQPTSNSANQWWTMLPTGDGYYYLFNPVNSLYVDVSGGSLDKGASIIQWPKNGGTNQQWQVIPV